MSFGPPLECVCSRCGQTFIQADYPFYTDLQLRALCEPCALAETPSQGSGVSIMG